MLEHHDCVTTGSTADPYRTPPLASDRPQAPRAPHVTSRRLLAGGRELIIEHAGQEYHLRLTRNDKLILTK